MPKEPEPSGTDAVFVVVCLLIVFVWLVSIMAGVTQEVLTEAFERFLVRYSFRN